MKTLIIAGLLLSGCVAAGDYMAQCSGSLACAESLAQSENKRRGENFALGLAGIGAVAAGVAVGVAASQPHYYPVYYPRRCGFFGCW